MSDIFNEPQPLDLEFPEAMPAPVDMVPIVRGMQGPQGERGPNGEPGNAVEIPDLSLIFDNVLAGPL